MQEKNTLFKGFFKKHIGLFKFIASKYVIAEDAEDIIADSFVALYDMWESLPSDEKRVGFMMVTMRNKSLNLIKRQAYVQRRISMMPREESEPEFVWPTDPVRFTDMFRHLPMKTKKIMRLVAKGVPREKISKRFRLTPKALRYLIGTAYASIRVRFDYFDGELISKGYTPPPETRGRPRKTDKNQSLQQ